MKYVISLSHLRETNYWDERVEAGICITKKVISWATFDYLCSCFAFLMTQSGASVIYFNARVAMLSNKYSYRRIVNTNLRILQIKCGALGDMGLNAWLLNLLSISIRFAE